MILAKRRAGVGRVLLAVVVIVIVAIAAGAAYMLGFFTPTGPADSVTLGIDVAPQGSHSIFFAAAAQGFYNRSRLDVHFVFGGGAQGVIQGIDKGQFNFGYTDLGTTTVLDSQGAHVVGVGTIITKPQIATFYFPSSGITTPKDLEGKTLADNVASSTWILFPAFAKLTGFNASKVKFVNVAFSGRNGMLLSGQAQAIGGFTGTVVPAFGSSVKYFLWADYGFNVYSQSILTSESMIQQHPDIVSRFVQATYDAVAWASQNQQAAVSDLLKAHPEVNASQAAVSLGLLFQSMGSTNVTPTKNIGIFNATDVASTISITCQYLKCASTVTPSQIYTNQFVQ